MTNSSPISSLLQRLHRATPAQRQTLMMQLEMERRRRIRAKTETAMKEEAETLLDFIPRVSPRYLKPTHLTGLAKALEETETQAKRIIVNLPPRHAKTETILHFIGRRLKRRPWENIGYVTYVDQLANEKSILARNYAVRAGLQMRPDANRLNRWITPELGGAIFTSIGGSITGQGVNVLVVDDPHKDRADAESPAARQRVWDWYIGTATDRVEVGGSIIICQTRWHPDDLTGRLLKEPAQEGVPPWQQFNLPAMGINLPDGSRKAAELEEGGSPLWPERWTTTELLKKKHGGEGGEYEWNSKFQQRPIKKGGAVFKDVRYYDPRTVPLGAMRISIGIDLAYTEDTHADHSAIVVLGEYEGRVYVLYAQREQMEIPQFSEIVRNIANIYPGARVHWHTSTTEKGTAQLLKLLGINVRHKRADRDKHARAQPFAASWNLGNVSVPGGKDEWGNDVQRPSWVGPYLTEMQGFTGLGDKEDDQVDASSSAFGAWMSGGANRTDTDETNYGSG